MHSERDNVGLICGIGELAGLLEKSSNIMEFLDSVTALIAHSMNADVCSIYLFEEETQDLVLRATRGLSPDAVGHVRLRLGEGITGTALKELRAIVEANGATNPSYKLVPDIQEERYQAFLAVPILRGLVRIGVLVLQHRQPGYFNDQDVKALRAVATQLAMAVENAKLLMTLHQLEPAALPVNRANPEHTRFIKGKPASEGIAFGTALVWNTTGEGLLESVLANGHHYTLEDFHRVVRQTEDQINELQRQLEKRLTDTVATIFCAHLLILKDKQFSGEIAQKIESGIAVPEAIRAVLDNYLQIFARSSNPRIREKVQDLKDLGQRLFRNLAKEDDEHLNYDGRIIVAGELLPSGMLKLVAQRAAGIILTDAGITAHISILARSLAIPMILVNPAMVTRLVDGMSLLMDANQGNLFLDPDDTILQNYKPLLDKGGILGIPADGMLPETFSRDGVRITLLANINLLSDLPVAHRLKAEGIGLYRTEFPFLIRNDFPTEEEQYQIYRKIITDMRGKEVVFRTLDIGGDKMLSYFPQLDEANPFLGLRAIRFSLRNRQIFTQQLRALLRAGADTRMKIMFPLVSSVDDFVLAREIVGKCAAELAAESIPHNTQPQLGVMIELPSAVEVVEELAEAADFLSIGTNDLIQYMLAVDRTNKQISGWYQPHHPAVLRSIKRITEAAKRCGKPLSLCGDMAAEPKLLPFLLGIGIRVLSLQPSSLPRVQPLVRQIDINEAEKQAAAILRLGRVSEVARFLNLPPPWPE